MLHVYGISVWITIQMQRLPLILNGRSTDRALLCSYEEIYFICVTYLFDFGLVFKLQFSFVIYIYIRFTFSYLAEPLSKRLTNEYNRRNQNQQKTNNKQVLY